MSAPSQAWTFISRINHVEHSGVDLVPKLFVPVEPQCNILVELACRNQLRWRVHGWVSLFNAHVAHHVAVHLSKFVVLKVA